MSGTWVNLPLCNLHRFFLRSLARSVPIRRNFQSNRVKWRGIKLWNEKLFNSILYSHCHFVFVYHVSNIAQHKMLDRHFIDAKFIYISRNSRFNGYNNNMRWFFVQFFCNFFYNLFHKFCTLFQTMVFFRMHSTPLVESLTFNFNFITPPHPNHHHKQYFWAAGKLCTLLILKILLFGEATILLIDPFPGKTPINYFCKLELPSVFVYLRNFWRKYRWRIPILVRGRQSRNGGD